MCGRCGYLVLMADHVVHQCPHARIAFVVVVGAVPNVREVDLRALVQLRQNLSARADEPKW
jgi:hypothetical protein